MNTAHLNGSSSSFARFPRSSLAASTLTTPAEPDLIVLPPSSLGAYADSWGMTRAVFFSYASLHRVLRGAEQNLAVATSQTLELNSRVVSAALAKGRHVELLQVRHAHVSVDRLQDVMERRDFTLGIKDITNTVCAKLLLWTLEGGPRRVSIHLPRTGQKTFLIGPLTFVTESGEGQTGSPEVGLVRVRGRVRLLGH